MLGTTASLTTRVANTAGADCTAPGLTVSSDRGEFALRAGAPAPGLTEIPGGAFNVLVDCTPVNLEIDNGTLAIDFNSQSLTGPLSGNGVHMDRDRRRH